MDVQHASPAARELGSLLATLNALVLDPTLDDAMRQDIAATIRPLVADREPPATRYTPDEATALGAGEAVSVDPRGTHPLYGAANGAAAAMRFATTDRLRVTVAYDVRHEGAPGWVHGGVIAAGFDVALGQAAAELADRGPTARVQTDFIEPTPVGTAVVYEAWIAGREGRKIYVEGELRRTDTGGLCARGDALFITPRST